MYNLNLFESLVPAQTDDTVWEITEEGDFLVEEGPGYEFVHPLVSTVVHDDLSLPRRRILHRRAAEALQAIQLGHETAVVGRLATHYAQAGDPKRAAHVSRTSRRTRPRLDCS